MIPMLDRLGGVSIYELAEELDVSVRTIRRDLDVLREAGMEPREEGSEERDERKKLWCLDLKAQAARMSSLIDAGHYLALCVAMGQAGTLGTSSPAFASLLDLADKIEAAIGPRGKTSLRRIQAAFFIYDKFAYQDVAGEVLWPLVDAISDRRVCTVTYVAPRPKPRPATYDVLPLRMFTHDRAVYLMCQFMKSQRIGLLNLHRLKALKVLDRTATPPADFDPARYAATAFGIHPSEHETTYVLRFDPEVAPYIRERVWHPSQKLVDLRGGGVELTFTCGESHEVTSWVASWREWVEVVEPKSLRDDLRTLAQHYARQYQGLVVGAGGRGRTPPGRGIRKSSPRCS